jgi:hypothetical protein
VLLYGSETWTVVTGKAVPLQAWAGPRGIR